ncbi:restriction endonuclease subunit S [Ruminococcus sp.]|uniref:restriction endonuclease subunit S n=1 Tax=Ruminococcus sp. TaxID=41978 RepID=UPI003AB2F909
MARAKKKAALTPEERLQAALVPDWEWPYKLPENWCWTRIGNYVDYVTDYVANGSFASLKVNVSIFKDENYALMVKTQDFANGFTKSLTYTDKHGYDFLSKSTLHGGELILSNIGSVGKVFRVPYFDRPMTLASNSVMVKCYNSRDYDWIYYFLLSPIGFEELKSITTGTAVPKFNKTDLKTIPLPVPPLAEQQRIVDRIESLFAKLDEAKEKAQAVVDSFETRKAAILHKAFTGELTKKWRKSENTRWVYKKIKDCCKLGSGGTPSRKVPDFYKGDIPWIKTGEIEWNDIYDTEEKITQSAIDNSSARCYKPGVVLVAMYGMGVTRGKASILRVQAATNQAVCVLEPQSALLYNRYLLYYFMRNYWDIREKAVGGNQLNLSLTIIKELNIEIPPIDEQMEIVQIIDNLFDKEQQTKEAAEAVLDQIDLMKKSILARAFRGELGTNDPSEESAVELLKQII